METQAKLSMMESEFLIRGAINTGLVSLPTMAIGVKMHLPIHLCRSLVGVTARVQASPPLGRVAALRGSPMRSRVLPISCFSTQTRLFDNPYRPHADSRTNEPVAVTTPSLSFEALGIGKRMKMFLMVCFCVFGTMETWFWYKAFWVWWKGSEVDEVDANGSTST
ncbi:hypothetical protein N7492_003820 [Penicillium capsulatum]|uniref:Uncharacterized protein n=1 Tax=Penicillium capsulatum TaxID=69766 RepID=A0A9W9LWX8_9EURO|nr:hypothetical protein N7492_003820 [Penicillium capsulatum]KAJ6121596.1 hypothetical protein N7512_004061 [Penicillium capsulatum]